MYKVGDKVSYSHRNHRATIIKVLPDDLYTVEFADAGLIPPQMTVPGDHLSAIFKGQCPRCGNPWTETIIWHETVYDCLKCNLKKEDC